MYDTTIMAYTVYSNNKYYSIMAIIILISIITILYNKVINAAIVTISAIAGSTGTTVSTDTPGQFSNF